MSTYPENDYRSYLQHSFRGTTWGKHKYIAIKNGRYIYPSDMNSANSSKSSISDRIDSARNAVTGKVDEVSEAVSTTVRSKKAKLSRIKNTLQRTLSDVFGEKGYVSNVKTKNGGYAVTTDPKKAQDGLYVGRKHGKPTADKRYASGAYVSNKKTNGKDSLTRDKKKAKIDPKTGKPIKYVYKRGSAR